MKNSIYLIAMLLPLALFSADYYVDGSVANSGNGLSWQTAWKTIQQATSFNLQPGDRVFIKNGTYSSAINITKSGSQIVPVTTGIQITDNKVYFPAGTSLSDVNLVSHNGQYYLYVYRSKLSNNGVYKITAVNTSQNFVQVEDMEFLDESGVAGDSYELSASIGRPIIFKNGSNNPETERVILDISSTNIYTIGYLGQYINNYDAYPVNYVIVDGIDLTGSKQGGGWHIQSSNHNVIMNSRIYNTGTVSGSGAVGILINGNSNRPANYNMLINNTIYNTPYEGIYIGAGGHPQANNHTHFNHIIGNKIFVQGTSNNAKLENAIDIKEYNIGNVVERNEIGPFMLVSTYNGAISIEHYTHNTLVYNNIIKNITKGSSTSLYCVIALHSNGSNNYIFNNLIYNTINTSGFYFGIYVHGSNQMNSYILNNTVYNIPRGIMLNQSGSCNTTIANNIFDTPVALENWSSGGFTLRNNLYRTTPNAYSSEPNRKVGDPKFADPNNSDFNLTDLSLLAINNGYPYAPYTNRDFALNERTSPPDIGAFEFIGNHNYVPIVRPTIQASNITFSNITRNSIQLNWTQGNGEKRIVLARQGNPIPNYPLSDGTTYAANSSFSAAPTVSSSKVVFNGTQNQVTVTNLSRNRTYHFRVFEYNGGNSQELYLQTTAANNPRTTSTLRKGVDELEISSIYSNFTYPNPANDFVNFNCYSNDYSKASIYLYDILGNSQNQLFDGFLVEGENSFRFDVSKLNSGSYFLIVKFDDEIVTTPFEILR